MKNKKIKVLILIFILFTSNFSFLNLVNAENISNDKKQSLINSIANKIKEEWINEKLIKDWTLCDPNGEYVYQLSSYLAEKYVSYYVWKVPKIWDKLAEWTSIITDTVINTFEYWTKNYREYVCEYWNTIIQVKNFKKDNSEKIKNIISNWWKLDYKIDVPENINIDKYYTSFNNVYKEMWEVSAVWFSKFFLGKIIDWIDNNIIDFNYFHNTLKKNKNQSDKVFSVLSDLSKLKIDYNNNTKNYNDYIKVYNNAVNQKNILNKEYNSIVNNLNQTTKQFQDKYNYEKYKQYSKEQVNAVAIKSDLYQQLLYYTNQKNEYEKKIKENDLIIWSSKKQIDNTKSSIKTITNKWNNLIKSYNNIK